MSSPPAPRRILMTTDTVGGVFDYAVELSSFLDRHGVEVLLATMGTPLTSAQARALAAIGGLKVFESRFKLEWMEEPWSDVDEAGEWLLELENSTRPDLVHLNGYVHAALPWRAPCLVVGHSCVLSWWRDVLREPVPDRMQVYQRRVARGLRHAAMVIAPSATMLRSLRDVYGGIDKARVIYNGRNQHDFSPGVKKPFIFAMGRLWDQAKNVRLVDEAAARLPWPVLVAGRVQQTGAANGPLPALEHARSVGALDADTVKAMLSQASIFVHPARYEPFGLAILEAALSGCALVLGDIPSLREIWHDAAIFVPTDDAARLARVLDDLIRDTGRRGELAERALQAATRYTPHRMGSEYLAAYRHALSASQTRRDEEKSVCA